MSDDEEDESIDGHQIDSDRSESPIEIDQD
jgi:hypothetical protein